MLRILMLEPFYGGSHKDFARGYQARSRHEIELVTLPDRFWKWRMRGAALYFARNIRNFSSYDVIFAGDMMDLTDLQALAGPDLPPVVLYFHENQLTYPLSPMQERDFHLGFTNIISACAADRVLFNSKFHMTDFFRAARQLIRKMPDTRPGWMMDTMIEKSSVIYPGCRIDCRDIEIGEGRLEPPLIVWNHRWEFDKCPEVFFNVLERVRDRGIDFSLAVLGERQELCPDVFEHAGEKFQDQIVVFGYETSHEKYLEWLKKGRVVISCAIQENFGISVVEAVRCGCFPLLPDRLSYPEIMPDELHGQILYRSPKELEEKLTDILSAPEKMLPARRMLSEKMKSYSWQRIAPELDRVMAQAAASRH